MYLCGRLTVWVVFLGAALSQRLRTGLDAFLERDGDRKVWGLTPRPKPSDAAEPPADELPPDPNKPPLAGWTPRELDQGWGAVLEGAQVADLPASDQLRGTPIVVTDRRGDAWTTTLTAVVSRSDTEMSPIPAGRAGETARPGRRTPPAPNRYPAAAGRGCHPEGRSASGGRRSR